MLRTCGQITDITGADLWVMDPSVRYIDDVKPMIENNLYRVRGVEGVKWAVPLYKGNGRAKLTSSRPTEGEDLPARRLERSTARPAPVEPVHEGARPDGAGHRYRRRPRPGGTTRDRQRDRAGDPARPRRRVDGRRAARRSGCSSASLDDLRKPDAVIVDRVRLRKLFPGCHLDEPFEKPESRRRLPRAAPQVRPSRPPSSR